ncbi:hypothetical protein QFZ63_005452 [Streptomyces sp. B3I7]|uniref:hypothetical protein n=1 Tax=Streptomyces sp. B3I7 TaxID=3042269 RepID=UPI002786136D|nr:hypothetical protein [Streptomyces sp. B3I7]MDQ0813738.1 hypothetical protein [Streptomyces sp. B3I7]
MRHHHAYLWTGPKARFDDEALRRPPHPGPPPPGNRPELIERYRQVAAEFRTSDLPPLETADWLVKPRSLVRGTWEEPKEAADRLGERLAEYAPPRFATEPDRDPARLTRLVQTATERLHAGADVSYGYYLDRPTYLTLAVVTCTPNRATPQLPCPCA